MPRRALFDDATVEAEINRLTRNEDVQLARAELRIKYRRRQYLYQLRNLEKRGKELRALGITADNIVELMECEEEALHGI